MNLLIYLHILYFYNCIIYLFILYVNIYFCNGETLTIRFYTLEKICKALNCSINDLFTTNDPTMQRILNYAYGINRTINKEESDTE